MTFSRFSLSRRSAASHPKDLLSLPPSPNAGSPHLEVLRACGAQDDSLASALVTDREKPGRDHRAARPRLPGAGAGDPGGGGPYSGWNRYATCFTGSTVMVLAPRIVATVASTW